MSDMEFDGSFDDLPPLPRRQHQKDQTRARILEAATALVSEGTEEAVTMSAVAVLAELTERTVHRYFKTRDDLLAAVWRPIEDLVGRHTFPQTADALVDRPRKLFKRLHDERKLVSAYLYSRARRLTRMHSDRNHQQAMAACVEQELTFLDDRSLRLRAAIIDVISSPLAWDLMRESWGFSPQEAGRAATEAVEILLNRRDAD